jgi:hypothetical protein
MKIDIKSGGKRYSVNFKISPGSLRGSTHLAAIAKSSKDLDALQDAISNRDNNDEIIGKIIASAIEKKLKLPIEFDYGYDGAGYGFRFDLWSISDKLK